MDLILVQACYKFNQQIYQYKIKCYIILSLAETTKSDKTLPLFFRMKAIHSL